VYALLDTRKKFDSEINGVKLSFLPFYIGKGSGDRCKTHLYRSHYDSSSSHKNRIIKKIMSEGLEVKVAKLFTNLTEQSALDIEVRMIKQFGKVNSGGILSNVTDGGDGIKSFSFKDESKRKISDSLKEHFKSNPASDETKSRTSKTLKKLYAKGK